MMRADDTGWPWILVLKGLRPIGNDAMRDKVEHLREEVNVLSRHVLSRRCDKFGTELPVSATLESILKKEKLVSYF